MANVKITELTAATALAATDVLPIVDVGADATKKVSVSDLLRNLPDGTASAPALAFADDQNSGILSPAENELAFATSGTQRLVIDSSGRLLLGTTTEGNAFADNLTVADSGNCGLTLRSGTSNYGSIYFSDGTSGADEYRGQIEYNHSTDALSIYTAGASAMRINSSGNVGIGTTSANSLVSIKKDISSATSITAANSQVGIFSGSGTGTQHRSTLYFSPINSSGNGSPAAISTIASGNTNSSLAFYTNGANNYTGTPVERLRIDSSGRLLLGTTTEGEGGADNLTIADSGNCGITIRSGTSSQCNIFFSDGTSGTPEYDGFIAYNQNNRDLKIGTASSTRLTIDSSGRVGIGTSSPGGTLHVDASGGATVRVSRLSANASKYGQLEHDGTNTTLTSTDDLLLNTTDCVFLGSTLRVKDSGNTTQRGAIYGDSSSFHINAGVNNAVFYSAGTERMRINGSGNVGIGTSSPSALLHISKQVNSGDVGLIIQNTGTSSQTASLYLNKGSGGEPDHRIQNDTGGNLTFARGTDESSYTEQMRIDSSGNVAIGTSTIGSAPLTLYSSASRTMYQGSSTGTGNGNGFTTGNNGGADAFVWNYENGFIQFATNNTERMRIDSIGSTTITCDATATGLKIVHAGGSGESRRFFQGNYSSSTESYRVWTNGDVENTNGNYGAISDAKLKENVVDASSQWGDIKDIRVRNYNFIEGQTHTQIGVVAQEVETVSPGLVSDRPDVDEDGNDLGTTTKSVKYSVLYMKAVKALQEAMERIETLEAKVAALEAQ
jgi:hypothetical protein